MREEVDRRGESKRYYLELLDRFKLEIAAALCEVKSVAVRLGVATAEGKKGMRRKGERKDERNAKKKKEKTKQRTSKSCR
jgi:hypothetical protein